MERELTLLNIRSSSLKTLMKPFLKYPVAIFVFDLAPAALGLPESHIGRSAPSSFPSFHFSQLTLIRSISLSAEVFFSFLLGFSVKTSILVYRQKQNHKGH
ncbi:hypothetical protein PGTUg99_030420 [Puccinia graminis f. sp. tritici]|uniref:Uncharacterized protein n=1 Tax=Puccinia graminis f. sp. tritici TaxID=56615 RepID=A0A5B0MZB5_PUCGR|nr:hypothetical protein PGTUg99_030420 [Puccinia graminis f. sp. tritici]